MGVAVQAGKEGHPVAGITAGGNVGKGKGAGNGTTYLNSHVGSMDSQTTITSGNKTNVQGGQIKGESVQVNAKALNFESLQDTSTYKSNQRDASGQVTVGYGGASGNANYSQSNIKANYASVQEQSGIYAGNGGYQVNVQNNTNLKGALITSTQSADDNHKNSLSTGTLTTSDLQNISNYKATGISVGINGSMKGGNDTKGDTTTQQPGKEPTNANPSIGKSVGFALDSKKDSSVTHSGINTSNISITNAAGQQALTGQTVDQAKAAAFTNVTTDTAAQNSGAIANNFDKNKVQKEVNLQMSVTQQFDANRQDAKAQINKQIDQAKAAGNTQSAESWQKAGVLLDAISSGLAAPTNSALGIAAATADPVVSYKIGQYFKANDQEGSAQHILAHAVLGAAVAAAGGNNALTAALSAGGAEAAAPVLANYLYGKSGKDLNSDEKATVSAIAGLVATGVGSASGSVASTVQAGQMTQNAVENNDMSSLASTGLFQYGASASSLAIQLAKDGKSPKEIHDTLSTDAKGVLPEGADYAKQWVYGAVAIPATVFLPELSLGTALGAGTIGGGTGALAYINTTPNNEFSYKKLGIYTGGGAATGVLTATTKDPALIGIYTAFGSYATQFAAEGKDGANATTALIAGGFAKWGGQLAQIGCEALCQFVATYAPATAATTLSDKVNDVVKPKVEAAISQLSNQLNELMNSKNAGANNGNK